MARTTAGRRRGAQRGAMPNLIVIGAMKCGTTALHERLDAHPDIAMSQPKELNFFFGAGRGGRSRTPVEAGRPWTEGNWHRGPRWYAAHFDPTAPIRGESSPGYTSPAHPEAAPRIAATLPDVRLIYLVRDPVERALSQYRHHVRDGTERRLPETALLDPDSQYIARSRYFARLQPFLDAFGGTRLLVVTQEELRAAPNRTLADVFRFLGVSRAATKATPAPPVGAAAGSDPTASAGPAPADEPHQGPTGGATARCTRPGAGPWRPEAWAGDVTEPESSDLRRRLADAVREDTERLRAFTGRTFAGWCG